MWHGGVNKFLAQVVIADAFDPPSHALRTVRAVSVWRTKHGETLPPPTVDGVLHHIFLFLRASHHDQQSFIPLALVEAFFFAHTHHGACIRAVGTTTQRDLVHDGSAIDQPSNHAHIGPGQSGVVEDRAVLGATGVQRIEHLVTAGAQSFCCAVEVETMARFVLHLGHQNCFAFE